MVLLRSSFLRLARRRLIDCTGRALPLYAVCSSLPIKLISEMPLVRLERRAPAAPSTRRALPAVWLLGLASSCLTSYNLMLLPSLSGRLLP